MENNIKIEQVSMFEMPEKKDKLLALRHSAEHVLTMAMLKLYPGLKAAMGPATDDGFYFDFDYKNKIQEKDFPKIEKEMQKIIDADLPITKDEMSVKEARKFFGKNTYKGNQYKHEWIDDIEKRGEKVSIYWMGKKGKDIPDAFVDICSGPHAKSTSEVKAFKLIKLAGAYWHGDEKNKMLTRIYGTAFDNSKDLKTHLQMLEDAEKFNHIVLGKQFELFSVFPDPIGSGLPILLPKGATVRRILERFIEDEEIKRGYQRVFTPDFAKEALYKISGHLPYYEENMYPAIKIYGHEFRLKPTTCPMHCMVFKSVPRSYRDLPLRIAELAKQYRVEKSGELHGLQRVAHFTLADSHIFCTEDQVKDEIKGTLDLVAYCAKALGFDNWWARLSLPDKNSDKYVKGDKYWKDSIKLLRSSLEESKIKYVEKEGEAAFYGPKIDIQMRNIHGKEDTIITVQVDYLLPERFDLQYIGKDNAVHRPVMVHRSSIGCVERTLAFLIEKYRGAFPVWLAPVQVKVLTLTDECLDYAQQVEKQIRDAGMRVESDYRAETVQAKIRDAEVMKIPHILVVGSKEVAACTIAVRERGKGKPEFGVSVANFIERVKQRIEERS